MRTRKMQVIELVSEDEMIVELKTPNDQIHKLYLKHKETGWEVEVQPFSTTTLKYIINDDAAYQVEHVTATIISF